MMNELNVGLELLKRPLVPLTFLVSRLFLTTTLPTIEEAVSRLKENILLDGVLYEDPKAILSDYLDALRPYERFKSGGLRKPELIVVDGDKNLLDPLAGVILGVKQEMMRRELALINSALCGLHHCTICCRGPLEEEENTFFELPLREEEIGLFDLPGVDTPPSRSTNAFAAPPYEVDGQAFYTRPSAIYRWRERWGMVLTKGSFCPNLDAESGRCRVYAQRPEVCRLPQIFPMVLEEFFDPETVASLASAHDVDLAGLRDTDHYYVLQDKILAVWDCPYVREYRDEIIRFAELSSLEPVFRQNKK